MEVRKVFLVLVLSVAVAGCAGSGTTKQEGGTAVGALVGGLIGAALGDDHADKQLATFVGALVGAGIGNRIGARLDERDRQLHAAAIQRSLDKDVGQGMAWNNPDSKNSGEVQVVKAYEKNDRVCKDVNAVITTHDGMTDQQTFTGCQDSDGGWTLGG